MLSNNCKLAHVGARNLPFAKIFRLQMKEFVSDESLKRQQMH